MIDILSRISREREERSDQLYSFSNWLQPKAIRPLSDDISQCLLQQYSGSSPTEAIRKALHYSISQLFCFIGESKKPYFDQQLVYQPHIVMLAAHSFSFSHSQGIQLRLLYRLGSAWHVAQWVCVCGHSATHQVVCSNRSSQEFFGEFSDLRHTPTPHASCQRPHTYRFLVGEAQVQRL